MIYRLSFALLGHSRNCLEEECLSEEHETSQVVADISTNYLESISQQNTYKNNGSRLLVLIPCFLGTDYFNLSINLIL